MSPRVADLLCDLFTRPGRGRAALHAVLLAALKAKPGISYCELRKIALARRAM